MRLPLILQAISSLCFASTVTFALTLSKPGCPEKCGNISIPYPFGIGSKCSANSSFTVTCQNSTNPPTPFLGSINVELLNISLYGIVIVKQPVSPLNCSDVERISLPISLKGSPFTISAHYNTLAVLGCRNAVWLRANETTTVGGCIAICDANSRDTRCNGVNCCQTTIPPRCKELQYTYQSIPASNNSSCGYAFPVDKKWLQTDSNNSSCGYSFPVDKKWLQTDYKRYKGLMNDLSNPFDQEFKFAPLVLEWEYGIWESSSNSICQYPDVFYYATIDYASSIRYCSCSNGFEGNPYLGCSDIDECSDPKLNYCSEDSTCINTKGSFLCDYHHNDGYYEDENDRTRYKIKIASISIGGALGGLILLIASWESGKAITKIINARRKHIFFKRNGGLLLGQQFSATENGLEKAKLYGSIELAKATDHYNENRILGHGGQGTVYKGMLEDGRIVAVKKSKRVDQSNIEVFINEVVILSQISHRNVVKLLGCCLETEVPRLVYEFIPNGTLFQHIHDPNEEFPLTWEMRVRIAREVAGALAYLHSAASAPIYHRDIKSANILLDEKYRAKVSDFGTSRSVAIDQTHLTTRVLGTFGYLDPEYFQSSQFTEKSDVYSFGVVVVELLTGEKAVTSIRAEEGRNLASHFLHSMEENQLFDIVDARVLKEGKREEIVAMAELARRCLHLNGKRRPTMREVAHDLEGIQIMREGSVFLQNQDDCRECNCIEVDESEDFSSTSGSILLDTITINSPDAKHPLLGEP